MRSDGAGRAVGRCSGGVYMVGTLFGKTSVAALRLLMSLNVSDLCRVNTSSALLS